MRLDLAASELLVLLQERWPYGGHGQLQAEMYVEDALRAVARAERERCMGLILKRIALLELSSSAFARNSANQLRGVIEEMERADEVRSSIVPEEEIDF